MKFVDSDREVAFVDDEKSIEIVTFLDYSLYEVDVNTFTTHKRETKWGYACTAVFLLLLLSICHRE